MRITMVRSWLCLSSFFISTFLVVAALSAEDGQPSYYRQVRPLFQARCNGCHQPAKPNGQYVMTSFDKLIAGGESGEAAIVPGKPDESYLVKLISPSAKGEEAEMPKGKAPLSAEQVAMIRQWISLGAKDDTPESAKLRFNATRPPTYSGAPVITSLDYSPDGKYLAVAGSFEVVVRSSVGDKVVARLIGNSERIESVRFSPDGKLLAVTGGNPGESGEVQLWQTDPFSNVSPDAATVVLDRPALALPIGFDVVYGVSWAPDGKRLAFGCSDKTVRAIEVPSGKQVLYQGTHEDRVLDTVFSSDGSHLISVSQDQTAKLTEIATQRFIDNITSITPGALKGGINAVERHPNADAILVGGADGEPKLYHVFRHTKRVIGDDANLIRRFPVMRGRVFDVAMTSDGKWAAACSSLDNSGQVRVYKFAFDMEAPAEISAISQKQVAQRTPEELKKLADYATQNVQQVAEFSTNDAGLYAVAFRPDGLELATAGLDGKIRLIDPQTGKLNREFVPVPVQPAGIADADRPKPRDLVRKSLPFESESLGAGDRVVAIEVAPANAKIDHPFDTVQLLVTAKLESGDRVDATRMSTVRATADTVAVSPRGLVTARHDGQAEIIVEFAGQVAKVPIETVQIDADFHPSFVRDVAPVISKMTCNVGTCHGANKGKGGLKLSLRGNDPVFDVRAYADELGCRRVNFASPDRSLILAKASANVPHEGSQLTTSGEVYYEIMRKWITDGAKLNLTSPRVVGIEIEPRDPIVQRIGTKQQIRVVATYSDGSRRDVTAEAHLESGNIEVATTDAACLATTLRRGEAAMLARFEGAYAGTTLTVMGDRTDFVWNNPPAWNFVDELVYAKLQRTKTLPSDLCSDADFVRRAYLDLCGIPPTTQEVREFLADSRETQAKRNELIDRLIGSPDFVEHWTNKWADLLQVNRKYLGVEGATVFRNWIREQLTSNVSYDKFVYSLMTTSGSNRESPAASFYKIHREPTDAMETTTHLFLGLRFNCNKCHDHPFERWTQDQYYETAAFFARTGLKQDPASGDKKIGGTAVEGATPLYEIVYDKDDGEVKHDRSGAVTPPKFPFSAPDAPPASTTSRRESLGTWLTKADNRYFARSFANRVWAYMMGTGLIEPIDDLRAGNPPTNAALLDRLSAEFVEHHFDIRHLMATICKSRTYQLEIKTNKWNEDDQINYSHAYAKRLSAEVLFDTLQRVTGSSPKVQGAESGARAATFLDPEVATTDGFLNAFGRPPRESACECERSSGVQFGPVMAMVSGATVGDAISDPNNAIAKLTDAEKDNANVVRELYLRILNRLPADGEVRGGLELFESLRGDHSRLEAILAKREAEFAPRFTELENERQKLIIERQMELSAYETEIAAREAELDRLHNEQIALRESELREYLAKLPEKLAAWEGRPDKETKWTPLDPHDLSSTSATTLTKQEDLSVLSQSSNGLGTYKFVANTPIQSIRAVRLEALSDNRSPNKGPGRAPDGNFVLTEFEVLVAKQGTTDTPTKIALESPRASFSQKGFDVAAAIDGRMEAQNGWGIGPKMGENHVALFSLHDSIGFEGGTTITVLLHHHFQSGEHSLGRFRVSVTSSPEPFLIEKPAAEIEAALNVGADQRNDGQRRMVLDFFRTIDPESKRREQAVADSRRPRPLDPRLVSLRDRLASAQKAVPIPPDLQQLREDVTLSAKQLEKERLIAAQDLAWALINSPAFLFNR